MANLDKILLNNTFTLPAGFNIDSTEPIDSRFQVDTKEDLYKDWGNAKVTNKDGVNEAIYKYDGLITYVKSEGKSYRYNSSLLTDENLKGWELVPVLSDIKDAPVQGISVDGVEIEPDENGIVNIILPDIDAKITTAIEDLDSTISAEKGSFITGITIEDGKLVSCTTDTVTIPEVHVPEYTIQGEHPEGATKTTYKLFKDTNEVPGSIIEVNDSEITFKEGDIYIADKHVLITSDLDDYLVKDIKDGDVLLSLNSNGEVSSKIDLKYETAEKTVVDSEGKESKISYQAIRLYGQNNEKPITEIDCTDFIKDGFLEKADYNTTSHILTLTWNTDSGIKTPTEIDLNGLIDVHDVVGGDGEDDLVKIVVDEKNENGVLTFTVSIDETNLQNKLDELKGAFIKSVVDKDTATYVKVNADTDENKNVTISVDESELSNKFESIEDRLDNIENNEVTKSENSSENFVKLKVNTDENTKDVTITIDDSDLKDKIDSIESNFSNYVELVDVKKDQSTLLKVEVDNTNKQKPVISLADNGLDERLTNLEGRVDSDTKCTSATINVADAPAASEDEVDVIAKQTIVLKGETGESLETEQPISSVKVVTKQYVDGKFAEVPTYEAITNSEIDALFV